MVCAAPVSHDGPMTSIWTVRRSTTDAKLGGLCGGVAAHWGIDPVLVRVGWAVLALSGGIGLVLYLAGWLLIPLQGADSAPVDDFFGSGGRRWPKEVWLTLVVIACLTVFALFGSLSPFGVAPAVVLAVIWYFGFYRNRAHRPGQQQASARPHPPTASLAAPEPPQVYRYPGPPTPFTEAAHAWRQRIEEHGRQAGEAVRPAAQPWPIYPETAPTRATYDVDPAVQDRQAFLATPDPVGLYVDPAPEPAAATALVADRGQTISARRLRLAALLVGGLTLAGLGLADGHGVTIPLTAYIGAALLVVGLTLVTATWLGRARGLLPIGFLLLLGLLAASAAGPGTQLTDWNSTTKAYTSLAELPAAGDSRDAGRLKVDLARLQVPSDVTYRAHVDTGSLEVVIPSNVNVVTRYTVDVGVVRTYGRQVDGGTDLHGSSTDPAQADPTKPTLTLDLSVATGDLEVRR